MSQKPSVLVVDDDRVLAGFLQQVLVEFYEVQVAFSAASAICSLENRLTDCILLDLQLGQENGLDFIPDWKEKFPQSEIVVLSGQSEVKTAIECIRKGAADYLTKPIDPNELLTTIDRTIQKKEVRNSLKTFESLARPRFSSVLGESEEWKEVLLQAQKLKHKTQLNVLILGESGTGKEGIARFLNAQEENSKRPFIVANMPAIPSNLLESELFGFEKGAFTDAKTSRPGKFELAQSGDIFLDEIGDLPLELQCKLLRVLQEKQSQRLGSHKYHPLKFRSISATNQNLAKKIEAGSFREDLFYRLSDIVITLPPLRERASDIPLLTKHFIEKHSLGGKTPPVFSEKALTQLQQYSWPGNIRQLESTIKRTIALNEDPVIEKIQFLDWSQLNSSSESSQASYQDQIKIFERELFKKSLDRNRGKTSKAINELGLSRATFYRKLQELGLTPT